MSEGPTASVRIDTEFLDYCNNRMPARIDRVEEQSGNDGEPSRILLHVHGLIELEPNAEQWDAAYEIARRFGLNPGSDPAGVYGNRRARTP
jgi:hypothetical protein